MNFIEPTWANVFFNPDSSSQSPSQFPSTCLDSVNLVLHKQGSGCFQRKEDWWERADNPKGIYYRLLSQHTLVSGNLMHAYSLPTEACQVIPSAGCVF